MVESSQACNMLAGQQISWDTSSDESASSWSEKCTFPAVRWSPSSILSSLSTPLTRGVKRLGRGRSRSTLLKAVGQQVYPSTVRYREVLSARRCRVLGRGAKGGYAASCIKMTGSVF